MSFLIEDKTVSSTGSFVASSFGYYYYVSRVGFISILTLLPGTQRIFSAWWLLHFVSLLCTCLSYKKKTWHKIKWRGDGFKSLKKVN